MDRPGGSDGASSGASSSEDDDSATDDEAAEGAGGKPGASRRALAKAKAVAMDVINGAAAGLPLHTHHLFDASSLECWLHFLLCRRYLYKLLYTKNTENI